MTEPQTPKSSSQPQKTHIDLCRDILLACEAEKKARDAIDGGEIGGKAHWRFATDAGNTYPAGPPDRPNRPEHPVLAPPGDVPRRRLTTAAGRFALLHAVAHIELNAIDLAADMAWRFADEIDRLGLDARGFVEDWLAVARDEGRHFLMLSERLAGLGGKYGDLPAHDGLWQAAEATSDAVIARLAIAPMVLEARGLDVTPGMIEKLEAAGDRESADVLRVIYSEEIDHVRKGAHWFLQVCRAKGLNGEDTFRSLVKERFNGPLKPPFNEEARTRADLPLSFYNER